MKTKLDDLRLFSRWAVEKAKNIRAERRQKECIGHKTYGILCAMKEEIQPVLQQMSDVRVRQYSGMSFFIGRLKEKKVVVVKCGIGKVNAAICTQVLCTVFHVDALIHIGVAGTPYPGIEQKDIVISTQTVQHDFDITPLGYAPGENCDLGCVYFPASLDLIRLAHQAAAAVVPENVSVYEGTIASGDQFIADSQKSQRIYSLFSAMAVEMEGAAVGQVAMIHRVPYVIIRGISDNADHSAELSYNEYIETAAVISANVVCKMMEMV